MKASAWVAFLFICKPTLLQVPAWCLHNSLKIEPAKTSAYGIPIRFSILLF